MTFYLNIFDQFKIENLLLYLKYFIVISSGKNNESIFYQIFLSLNEKIDKVKENDNLINTLQKELQNILKFLGDSKEDIVTGLKQNIIYEYKFFESKKKSTKSGNQKSQSKERFTKKEFSLTIKEKDLYKNYFLQFQRNLIQQ